MRILYDIALRERGGGQHARNYDKRVELACAELESLLNLGATPVTPKSAFDGRTVANAEDAIGVLRETALACIPELSNKWVEFEMSRRGNEQMRYREAGSAEAILAKLRSDLDMDAKEFGFEGVRISSIPDYYCILLDTAISSWRKLANDPAFETQIGHRYWLWRTTEGLAVLATTTGWRARA